MRRSRLPPLPAHGRTQGRYWIVGDIDGAPGRSLFVRLHGPGIPGKWTDAASGAHGDLFDIIRHRTNAPTLRAALDEARAFLALEPVPASGSGKSYDAGEAARNPASARGPPTLGEACPPSHPRRGLQGLYRGG